MSQRSSSSQFSADILQNVKNESVAVIIHQCEKRYTYRIYTQLLYANQGRFGFDNGGGCGNKDYFLRIKSNFPYRCCGKYGHWKDDYNTDLSLKLYVPSFHKGPNDGTIEIERQGKCETLLNVRSIEKAQSRGRFHVNNLSTHSFCEGPSHCHYRFLNCRTACRRWSSVQYTEKDEASNCREICNIKTTS